MITCWVYCRRDSCSGTGQSRMTSEVLSYAENLGYTCLMHSCLSQEAVSEIVTYQ